MNEEAKSAFIRHAKEQHPKECCGFLIKTEKDELYIGCDNVAGEPEKHFVISAEDYACAEEYGEILAICHSHPNSTSKPSAHDIASCNSSGLPWFILAWPDGDIRELKPTTAPLIGRKFVHGTDHDCYGLIKDYFKLFHNIDLPQFEHTRHWWEKGETLYNDNYAAAGFEKVYDSQFNLKDLKIGDMIVMQIRASVPNHGAIYMGNNRMMHHMYGKLSKIDIYGGYWQERTSFIARHKALK